MSMSFWKRLVRWWRPRRKEPAAPAVPVWKSPGAQPRPPTDEAESPGDDPTRGGTDDPEAVRRLIGQIIARDTAFEASLTGSQGERRQQVLDAIAAQFKLPSLAAIAQSLQQAIHEEDHDLNAIVEKIEADASLAAQVLKIANSAYMRGETAVDSLHDAALQMGSSTLRQLILSLRVINAAQELAPDFDWTHLWRHNFAVSILAVDLQTIFGLKSQRIRGIGLIHDLGKVILSDLYPGDYALAVQRAFEQGSSMGVQELDLFGITHEEVAAQYVVHHGFHAEIQEALLFQNQPAQAPHHAASAALLQLSNYFAKLHGLGYSGDRSYLDVDYEQLEGWSVLLRSAGAEQQLMIERYEGYLRASLRASLAQARAQVESMFRQ